MYVNGRQGEIEREGSVEYVSVWNVGTEFGKEGEG